MLDRYVYDVPFYARLETPVRVVLDWTDPVSAGATTGGRRWPMRAIRIPSRTRSAGIAP
jgi:hypothetical protein